MASKTNPQKACLLGVRTEGQIMREDVSIQEKQAMPYHYYMTLTAPRALSLQNY